MIAVQLLASCFTQPQNMNTLTLPSGWYDQRNRTDDTWLNTRLVSSLRQQTQWKHSPAFGHQARNNSAASLWPRRDDALSREALLAEHISLNRRLRHREHRGAKKGVYTKWRRQSESTGEKPKRHRFSPSHYLRRLRTSDSTSSEQYLRGLPGSQSDQLSSRGRVKQKNALKLMRGLRLRNMSDDSQRWSFEPFLRSENHSVFVQPVKEYVTKRCGVFRSRGRNQSSISSTSRGGERRPDYQRAASSTSKDSIQLSRRTQIMTVIQDSGASLGHFALDTVGSSQAPVGKERSQSLEAEQGLTSNAQATAKSEPKLLMERLGEDLSIENTNSFPSEEWVPCHYLQSPELGQTRNRTSTSGTIVYNPHSIAEASLDSKELESDASTSSGTLSGTRDSKFEAVRSRKMSPSD